MTSCELVTFVSSLACSLANCYSDEELAVLAAALTQLGDTLETILAHNITEAVPNNETVSAMLEAERIAKDPAVKGYHNVDELFADLDS